MKLSQRKPITKKQAQEDILSLADELARSAACAPNKPTQLYYQRMARDIRIAEKVHFQTTK